jgi:hypothetical protein
MKDIQDVVPKQLEYASTVRQQGAIGTLCGETKRGTHTEGGLVCPSSDQLLRARQHVKRAKPTLPAIPPLRARSVPLCTRGLYTQRLKIGLRLITRFITVEAMCNPRIPFAVGIGVQEVGIVSVNHLLGVA